MATRVPHYPPQQFVNDLDALHKSVPTSGWQDLPEWPIWAKGYNAGIKDSVLAARQALGYDPTTGRPITVE